MQDNDDLFEIMNITPNGTAEDPDDLFGGVAPSAAETNKNVFDNATIDINGFVSEKRQEWQNSPLEAISQLSRDENGETNFQWYNPLSWIGSGISAYRKTIDDRLNFLEQNKNMVSNLITAEQFEEFKAKGAIGIYESAKRNVKWGNAPFVGSFVEGYEKGRIFNIMKKIKNGETLSKDEDESVKEYILDGIEQTVRGHSIGGRIIDGLAQMPAFMIEYATAKGLVGVAAKKAGTTVAGKKIAETATKVAASGKVGAAAVKTSQVVGSAAGRALFMPGQVYNNYNDII